MWARGNRRQLIFVENADRHIYLALLGKCVERAKWSCLAYCLMDNHVHLLVETERPNLSAGMQWLHGQYARGFNHRHRQVGHLFQGPFGSNRMADERQLISTIGYIALNPCAAGLCSDPERLAVEQPRRPRSRVRAALARRRRSAPPPRPARRRSPRALPRDRRCPRNLKML